MMGSEQPRNNPKVYLAGVAVNLRMTQGRHHLERCTFSETQGQSVGPEEKARRKPVLENFPCAFSPGPTDCPWVSEDGGCTDGTLSFLMY